MKKQNKLLQLNKETLIALQDKQMSAIRGGQEVYSITGCGTPSMDTPCEPDPEPEVSCCKKTCRGEKLPAQS